MEIEITGNGHQRLILVVLFLISVLIGLGLLGRFVTPVEAEQPVLLLPDRWQAANLARKARAETRDLYGDAERLLALLDEPSPDPVSAMLLAQGIYARHRTGTSATATARQALITAAESVARYAAGSVTWAETALAVEEALQRLEPLLAGATTSPQPAAQAEIQSTIASRPFLRQQAWLLFLPLVISRTVSTQTARAIG